MLGLAARPEREHQRLDRERHDEHHHEAREKAAHACGRAHLRLAVDLLLENGLAELERRHRDRKHCDALEHRAQALVDRHVVEKLDALPELQRGHHDERDRPGHEEQADHEMAYREYAVEQVGLRRISLLSANGASAPISRAIPLLRDYAAARLCLAEEPPAGGLYRAQPGALRLRRGARRRHRAAEPGARRAQLLLARLRQSRRRLALPRAIHAARHPGWRARQYFALRLLP